VKNGFDSAILTKIPRMKKEERAGSSIGDYHATTEPSRKFDVFLVAIQSSINSIHNFSQALPLKQRYQQY
jgi:hypothetical protein